MYEIDKYCQKYTLACQKYEQYFVVFLKKKAQFTFVIIKNMLK